MADDRARARQAFALGFLVCAGALAYVYYLQYAQGLTPCPLCIFQRMAMAATGLVFLIGLLHGPRGGFRISYALLAALLALIGALIAARHVWIQSLPADQVPACAPPLNYLISVLPPVEVIRKVLQGDGECHKVSWTFLGLSLPFWSMIGFIALTVWALACGFTTRLKIRKS
jgi:disulfide bond formation protein DsbB